MQSTLRPYVTAGVASAAASVIAVTPVATPLPDIQVPAVQLSAASTDLFGTLGNSVDALLNPIGGLAGGGSVAGLGNLPGLSGSLANLDPAGLPNFLTPYADLVTNTLGNLDSLSASWLADPFPFLRQVLTNQLGYGQTFLSALENALTTGNLADLSPILTIPESIAQNITNVFQTLTDTSIDFTLPTFDLTPPFIHGSPEILLGLPLALLVDAIGTPYETFIAAENSFNTFVGAVDSGNVLGALGELFDAPANIANGFLNGTTGLPIPPELVEIPPIAFTVPGLPPFIPPGSATITPSVSGTIPLGGLLAPLMHPSLALDATCAGSGTGIAACLPINLLFAGGPINTTVGGTPIGGIVPALVNYLPQQLAAAITPHAAAAATSADLVNAPLQTLLGGAGLEGLLNPADLGALFDSSALTSLLDGGLAPALTGLFDPAAVSGIASTLGADLVAAIGGLF